MKSDRSRKVGIVLVLIAALVNFVLGVYHWSTREGWRSGVTELVTAGLLLVAVYFISRSHKS